jgi:hypothetical protein
MPRWWSGQGWVQKDIPATVRAAIRYELEIGPPRPKTSVKSSLVTKMVQLVGLQLTTCNVCHAIHGTWAILSLGQSKLTSGLGPFFVSPYIRRADSFLIPHSFVVTLILHFIFSYDGQFK